MRKLTYLAVLEASGDGGYGVFFPDVPGCISCGDNIEQTLGMAREALELHIYGMEQDGEALPEKTDVLPRLAQGDIVSPVSIYPDLVKDKMDNRREKTTITLPHWLKAAAKAEGINYSRMLEITLKETLGAAL
jgi:predicted RNase H-like HicB family nuclease